MKTKMNFAMKKRDVIAGFFSLLSILIIMLLPTTNKYTAAFIVLMTSFNVLPVLYDSIKKKIYSYFLFIAINYEILITNVFLILAINLEETSWRIEYAINSLSFRSMEYLCISTLIFSLMYYLSAFHFNNTTNVFFKSWVKKLFALIIFLFIPVVVFKSGFFVIRDYSNPGNSIIISLYRILSILFLTMFFKSDRCSDTFIDRVLVGMLLMIGIIIGLLGYRFILLDIILLLFILVSEKKNVVTFKNIVLMFLGGFILYIGLTLIRNYPFGNDFNIIENFFRHERNIFYSLNAILAVQQFEGINTYWNSLLCLVPFNYFGALNENTGRILLSYINYDMYQMNTITLGGFYIAEAIFSFGLSGIVFVNVLLGSVFTFLEKKRNRVLCVSLFYYFFMAQICSVIFYGSSNYFKILVVHFVCCLIISLCNNFNLNWRN